MDMDDAEAMAAGMVVMQRLNIVTTAAAALGKSCCVTPFESARTHKRRLGLLLGQTGQPLVQCAENFGSRAELQYLYDGRMLANNEFEHIGPEEAKSSRQ